MRSADYQRFWGKLAGGEKPPHLLVTGRGLARLTKEPDVLNISAPPPRPSRITPLKLGRP